MTGTVSGSGHTAGPATPHGDSRLARPNAPIRAFYGLGPGALAVLHAGQTVVRLVTLTVFTIFVRNLPRAGSPPVDHAATAGSGASG